MLRFSVSGFLLGLVISVTLSGMAGATESQIVDSALVEAGKKIYLEGILPNGKPLQAKGAASTAISGTRLTCVGCHRRSGLGSSEGGQRIPPIVGKILFEPRTQIRRNVHSKRLKGAGARPAYTVAELEQAITSGFALGRELDPLMPRFELKDSDLDALIAYLRSLDISPAPGISDSLINVATVIGPNVPEQKKQTMLSTLQSYFHDFNAQTRGEQKRADHSPWHKTWHYQSFRSIRLHAWQLQGDPDTWQQQLNNFYKTQPVYALVNGISTSHWAPVHKFCESNRIPCLFPTTDIPVYEPPGYYSIYFSAGIKLETATLLNHLQSFPDKGKQRVVQVYRDTLQGKTAARELSETNDLAVINHLLPGKEKLTRNFWRKLIAKDKPDILVLWVDVRDVEPLMQYLGSVKSRPLVFLSDTFTTTSLTTLAYPLLDNTYLLSRFGIEKQRKRHLMRVIHWARPRHIDTTEIRVVANAYFAATKFGSAVKNMRAYLTRDYLLEQFEHMLENNVFHSVYPRLSLGPEQRFASKGAFVIGPLSQQKTPGSPPPATWITPTIQ